MALADVARLPFTDENLRYRVHSERDVRWFQQPHGRRQCASHFTGGIAGEHAYAFRIGGWIGGQDIGLSYHRGFSDVPQAVATHTVQDTNRQCNPENEEECIDGLLYNQVELAFPRMHVAGFNMAGEFNPLG